MLILSLDIETTAIDPEKGQLLSLGAVMYDSVSKVTLGEFHGAIKHEKLYGDIYALCMNAELIKQLSKNKLEEGSVYPDFGALIQDFIKFLRYSNKEQRTVTLCGKNIQRFDLLWLDNKVKEEFAYTFLELIEREFKGKYEISRRILDVGPMYASASDEEIPNLSTCMSRAGIDPVVTHHALQDARDTLAVAVYKLTQNEEEEKRRQ